MLAQSTLSTSIKQVLNACMDSVVNPPVYTKDKAIQELSNAYNTYAMLGNNSLGVPVSITGLSILISLLIQSSSKESNTIESAANDWAQAFNNYWLQSACGGDKIIVASGYPKLESDLINLWGSQLPTINEAGEQLAIILDVFTHTVSTSLGPIT